MKQVFSANLSYAYYEQLWDGSDQTTVSVRNLKDGFKSLEPDYFGTNSAAIPNCKDEYVK